MMYIEHTPLEDNLQFFVKNHIPASDANSILAHVRDVDETTATQLQTQTQANVAYYSGYTGRLNVLKISDAPRSKIPNIAERQEQNIYLGRTKVSPPGVRNRNAVSPKLNGNGKTAYEEEGEEDEKYELVDIVDVQEEEEEEQIATKHNKQTLETQVRSAEKEHTPVTDEIIIQIEDEEDNYEYSVQPVCKQRKYSETKLPNKVFGHRRQSNYEATQTRKRPLRPVPAAIPIKTWHNELELPPLELIPPQTRRNRVLNGHLPIQLQRSDSTESVTSSYYLTEDDVEYAGQSYANGYRRLVAAEAEVEEFAATEEDYDEHYSLPVRRPEQLNNSQMGIDIFNRLRRLLNLNTDSTGNTEGEQKRKRTGNYTADANPHPIKYKKVHNRFPKIITHRLDDADFEVISTFPQHEKQMLSCKLPSSASKNTVEMTQRKSLHSIEKPKYRKSMFTAPTVTHRLIKNTSYADVEFSDDDEPQLTKGFGIGVASGSNVGDMRARKKVPHTYNVPIVCESENARTAASKPPPPLIEPRTGSILATSLMPEIDLTKRRPMSYSDVLRQNLQMPASGGHVLGRRSASSVSSSGATSQSNGGLNILGNIRSNMWSTNARSILTQEKETEEHVKYQQLLEQVVPCLYGAAEGANVRTFAKPTAYGYDVPQRRDSSGNQKPLTQQRQSLSLQDSYTRALKRPPLSSTINLDDDDDDAENNEDVTFVGVQQQQRRPVRNGLSTVIIDDDEDEISEIIDLDDDEQQVVSACTKLNEQNATDTTLGTKDKRKSVLPLPYVEPVNTLQERFNTSPHLKANWLEALRTKWTEKKKSRLQEVNETVNVVEKLTAERRAAELEMHERLRKIQIVDPELLVIDDFPEPEVEEEPEFIELTQEHQNRIKAAVMGSPDQVLVSKFNLNITRRDIHTLMGQNWLNDEVINFYMNLLTERGDTKHDTHGLPTVYAMNTFFVPRLLSAGHSGVKRWTRKVDIFAKDIIPVPVHVGGVHWCMAIIHLKKRTIKYYDSMGTPNPSVLKALEQYLKDESLDKRKQPFDTSQFEIESVRDVPRQMNGSDCGVFSCMFAEYITRNREITFSQQHMQYFRHKMILEIVSGELLQ
uniref:Sentrin-specific protease 1 n=1 Tax=Zeugodacus cucurbitae TaxID=28588 RepID=A0A0A1WRA7_ZEUCU